MLFFSFFYTIQFVYNTAIVDLEKCFYIDMAQLQQIG